MRVCMHACTHVRVCSVQCSVCECMNERICACVCMCKCVHGHTSIITKICNQIASMDKQAGSLNSRRKLLNTAPTLQTTTEDKA